MASDQEDESADGPSSSNAILIPTSIVAVNPLGDGIMEPQYHEKNVPSESSGCWSSSAPSLGHQLIPSSSNGSDNKLILNDTFYRHAIERYRRDRENAESSSLMRKAMAMKKQTPHPNDDGHHHQTAHSTSVTKVSLKSDDSSSTGKDGADGEEEEEEEEEGQQHISTGSSSCVDTGKSSHQDNKLPSPFTTRTILDESSSGGHHIMDVVSDCQIVQGDHLASPPQHQVGIGPFGKLENKPNTSTNDLTHHIMETNVPTLEMKKKTLDVAFSGTDSDGAEAAVTLRDMFGKAASSCPTARIQTSSLSSSSCSHTPPVEVPSSSTSSSSSIENGTKNWNLKLLSSSADALNGFVRKELPTHLTDVIRSPLKKRDIKVLQSKQPDGRNKRTSIPAAKSTGAADGAPRKRRKSEHPPDAPLANTLASDDLEKKRLASRTSSRRTREREKMKLDYYEKMQTKLTGKNEDLRSENAYIRSLIAKTRQEMKSSLLPSRLEAAPIVVPAAQETVITTQAPKMFHQAIVSHSNIPPVFASSLSVSPVTSAAIQPSSSSLATVERIPAPTTLPASLGAGQQQQSQSSQGILDAVLLSQLTTGGEAKAGINSGTISSSPTLMAQLLSDLQSQASTIHSSQQHQQPSTADAILQQLLQSISMQRQQHDQPGYVMDGGVVSSRNNPASQLSSPQVLPLQLMNFAAPLARQQHMASQQTDQFAAMMAAAQASLIQSLMIQSQQAIAPQRMAVGAQELISQYRHQENEHQQQHAPSFQRMPLPVSETPTLQQMQQQLLHLHQQIEKKQLEIIEHDVRNSKYLLLQQKQQQQPGEETGAGSPHQQQQQSLWLSLLADSLRPTYTLQTSVHLDDPLSKVGTQHIQQPQQHDHQQVSPQQIQQLLQQQIAAIMNSQGGGQK